MKKIPSLSDPKRPPKNETPLPPKSKQRKVNILTNKHCIDQNAILLKNSNFFSKKQKSFIPLIQDF